MKFCKDCKWFRPHTWKEAECTHQESQYKQYPLYYEVYGGEVITKYCSCHNMRLGGSWTSPPCLSGKLWEKRDD